MAIFEFSFSKYLLFPFTAPFINVVQELIFNAEIKGHIFLRSALFFLGEMLSIFIEIFAQFYQRRKRFHSLKAVVLDNELIIKTYNDEMDEQLKEKQKNLKAFIIFSCLLDFLIQILMSFFLSHEYIYLKIQLECKAIPLFVIAFINKYMFRVNFEKHHKISMVIIFLGTITVFIFHFIFQVKETNLFNTAIITLLFLIVKIITGVKVLLDTYILQAKYASPFKLLFYQGLFGFTVSIFCALLVNNRKCFKINGFYYCTNEGYIDNFQIFFDKFKNTRILLTIIAYCFMVLLLNVLRKQTKYYLTAFHRVLSCISTAILNWVIFLIGKQKTFETVVIIEMIGFIVILFGELVYAEVIICKFMGLDEDTKKEILKRGEVERTNTMLIIKTFKSSLFK